MLPARVGLSSRVAGVSGIVSQIVIGVTLAAAIVRSPWFSWTGNELSVLGVNGPATALVRWGFIVGGLLNVPFALGLAKTLPRKRLFRSGAGFLVLGALALAGTGVFPRSIDLPHDLSSVLFFVFVSMSLTILGAGAVAASRVAWGLSSLAAGVLMAVLQVVSWPWEGGAIPQVLAAVPWSVWTIANGSVLAARRTPSESTV